MKRTGKSISWQLAGYLLAARRSKEKTHGSTSLLFTISVAAVNLLFCVLCEGPIKEDAGGRALSLFLFVQGVMIFLLTSIHLAGTGAELLRKSLVMPVPSTAHLVFVLLSSAFHPVLQSLVLSDVFFFSVIYHRSVETIIMVPLLFGLMAADIMALTAVGSVRAIRRSRPPTIIAAYCILGIIAIITIALMFHVPAAIAMLPPLSWTTRGIVAARAGELGVAALCGLASLALLAVTVSVGRRMA